MASLYDNFSLGLAGVGDLLTRADDAIGLDLIPNSTLAADTYAEQVARGGASGSVTLDGMKRNGASSAELAAAANKAGLVATDKGELGHAARNAVDQVADGVSSALKVGTMVAVVALVVVAGVAAAVYLPRAR